MLAIVMPVAKSALALRTMRSIAWSIETVTDPLLLVLSIPVPDEFVD